MEENLTLTFGEDAERGKLERQHARMLLNVRSYLFYAFYTSS